MAGEEKVKEKGANQGMEEQQQQMYYDTTPWTSSI